MGLDSSLFAAQIPAATYAAGDRIPMGCIRGAANVRAGYGQAILKKVFTIGFNTGAAFKVVVKNSNWVDSMSNPLTSITETSLEDNSTCIQRGHDCDLYPNSSWEVYLECITAGTETANAMAFALIDIDFPSVSSITNPRSEKGFPVTIDWAAFAYAVTAATAVPASMVWTTANVDIFKAGSRYLLDQVSMKDGNAGNVGFVEISGAAGQNGLIRIVPCRSASIAGIKYLIDYATPLVKGPMNIAVAAVGTAGSSTCYLYTDWVKR